MIFICKVLQDDGSFDVVEGSNFFITRVAFRDNSSKYYINDRGSNFTEVTKKLKEKGVDLDNNRFLILQVCLGFILKYLFNFQLLYILSGTLHPSLQSSLMVEVFKNFNQAKFMVLEVDMYLVYGVAYHQSLLHFMPCNLFGLCLPVCIVGWGWADLSNEAKGTRTPWWGILGISWRHHWNQSICGKDWISI